jgi:predicted methyltransferase
MNQIEDRALQPIRECVDAGGIAEIDVIVHDVRLVLTDSPAGLDDPPAVLRRLFDKASSDPLRTANDQRHFDGIALFHFDSPFDQVT